MARRKKKWISIVLAVVLLIAAAGSVFIYNKTEAPAETPLPEIELPSENTGLVRLNHTLPSSERSFYIRPGVDICAESMDAEALRSELSALFADMLEMGCTSLYFDTFFEDGTAAYSTTVRQTGKLDLLDFVMRQASENNINVYAVYHIFGGGTPRNFSPENLESIESGIAEFSAAYHTVGIILTDYYTEKSTENYYDYLGSGSGGSFEMWLTQKTENIVKQAAGAFIYADNAVPVGLLCDAVWSNAPENPQGSNTKGASPTLGKYADTKRILEQGYVDFAVVNIFTAIEDAVEPFNEVLSWWNQLSSDTSTPLSIIVAAHKIATDEEGWKGHDQIIRQASGIMNLASTNGRIVFFGYKRLLENPFGIKDFLISYFNENYDENALFKDLTITKPKSPNVVTTEDKITFEGSFDPNFGVEINGNKLWTVQGGEFAAQFPLEMGKNTFVLSSKGNSQLYTITRKIQVLKEISPVNDTKINGGIALTVSAVAYDGATVTATLNGKTIKLNKTLSDDQTADGAYSKYTGVFSIPESTNKEQNLGAVKFKAGYGDWIENRNGGSITINKLMTLVDTPVPPGSGNFPQVRVNSKYADVFSPGNTCPYSSAYYYQLPFGTIDYVNSEYTLSGEKYYMLHSGKRIKASSAEYFTGPGHGQNSLASATGENKGGATYLRFACSWNASFNILFPDEKYGVGKDFGDNGDTNYSVSEFKGTRISIEFDYSSSTPKLTLPNGGIFSAAHWDTKVRDNIPRSILTLTLRNPGKYYGAYAYYEGNILVFKFYNPSTSLSGVRIYVDAGHGMPNDPGAIGYGPNPGQFIRESDINKAVCDSLSAKLKAMGAAVSYDSSWLSINDRISTSIDFEPQLFVSVHSNSGGPNVSGSEVYYNTPFSYPLGGKILNKLGAFYNNTLYPGGGPKTRGVKHSGFGVTRQKQFASVLTEIGFISNWEEAKKLQANPSGFAEAIAQGIKAYVLE